MINISNLKKNAKINVSRIISVTVPRSFGVLDKTAEIEVKAELINNDGLFLLTGNGVCSVRAECSLCLTEIEMTVSFALDEVFSESGESADSDIWPINGKMVDIEPAIASCFISSIPAKIVCSDECRGLCPKCGRNLNASQTAEGCDC